VHGTLPPLQFIGNPKAPEDLSKPANVSPSPLITTRTCSVAESRNRGGNNSLPDDLVTALNQLVIETRAAGISAAANTSTRKSSPLHYVTIVITIFQLLGLVWVGVGRLGSLISDQLDTKRLVTNLSQQVGEMKAQRDTDRKDSDAKIEMLRYDMRDILIALASQHIYVPQADGAIGSLDDVLRNRYNTPRTPYNPSPNPNPRRGSLREKGENQ
jgi:hypothetical protein